MAAKGPYEHMAIVVELDERHGVILDAQCTLVTDLAKDFLKNILKGYSLNDDVDKMIADVKEVYHGAARNAIIASLKDLSRTYQKLLSEKVE